MRHGPRASQRRPDVTTRDARHAGRPAIDLRRRDSATSSISGCAGNPPASSNSARVTNMPWSPVAMPVSRERRFISAATSRRTRGRPSMRTSKRPHRGRRSTVAGSASAATIATAASAGSRVSACRNSSTSPVATAAPAFICIARPRAAVSTTSACGRAARAVPSALPPSTTITSWPAARNGASDSSAATMPAASFSVGTTIDRRFFIAGPGGAPIARRAASACSAPRQRPRQGAGSDRQTSAPPQLEPWPAVQP